MTVQLFESNTNDDCFYSSSSKTTKFCETINTVSLYHDNVVNHTSHYSQHTKTEKTIATRKKIVSFLAVCVHLV
jgi:hypothetical protein